MQDDSYMGPISQICHKKILYGFPSWETGVRDSTKIFTQEFTEAMNLR